MAIVNRLYFETPSYTASYDVDNAAVGGPELVAVHVDNEQGAPLTIEIRRSADDSLITTQTFGAGKTDVPIPAGQRQKVTLTPEGKVTNLYARTA